MSDAVVPVARTYSARNGSSVPSATFFHSWSAPPPTPRIVTLPPVPTNSALGTSASGCVSLATTASARRAGALTLSITFEKPSLISSLQKKAPPGTKPDGAARRPGGGVRKRRRKSPLPRCGRGRGRACLLRLGRELHQLDRFRIAHLPADPLRRVEVDERLVRVRIAQDLRLGALGDEVTGLEVAEGDGQAVRRHVRHVLGRDQRIAEQGVGLPGRPGR